MKIKRKIVQIDEDLCNGCGECVPGCAEGALRVIDGKARLVLEIYCDGLGACLGHCPQGAIQIIEREADEFDEEAVEEYLKKTEKTVQAKVPHACPSGRLEIFESPCDNANKPGLITSETSALSHWPVQIKLVPPAAPFLRGADLLVTADCIPVAYPNFHNDFLKERVVMIGCPKFDNVQEYVNKFAEIFRIADVKSVTVMEMEVPCCSKLPLIVQKGMELASKQVPMEEVVISIRGKILKRTKVKA